MAYAQMAANRKKDVCVHAAVCDVPRTVHYAIPGGGASVVGGIVEFMADGFKESWLNDEVINNAPEVTCVPLSHILKMFGFVHIDFWSLDVEGGELAVLETFDFNSVTVSVVVIECDAHDPTKDEEIVQLMIANNFEHQGTFGRNCWFQHRGFTQQT